MRPTCDIFKNIAVDWLKVVSIMYAIHVLAESAQGFYY